MSIVFTLYATGQSVREITAALPPEVQQLAGQLEAPTQQILADANYGLLVVGLAAAITLLVSSLLLVLNYPALKPVQPRLRLIRSAPTHQLAMRPAENHVATRTNRDELRLVSARIRAGQLSN